MKCDGFKGLGVCQRQHKRKETVPQKSALPTSFIGIIFFQLKLLKTKLCSSKLGLEVLFLLGVGFKQRFREDTQNGGRGNK